MKSAVKKRRTPLQVLWQDAKCVSLANGEIRVTPTYRTDSFLFERMYAARQLQRLIRRELKGK